MREGRYQNCLTVMQMQHYAKAYKAVRIFQQEATARYFVLDTLLYEGPILRTKRAKERKRHLMFFRDMGES